MGSDGSTNGGRVGRGGDVGRAVNVGSLSDGSGRMDGNVISGSSGVDVG